MTLFICMECGRRTPYGLLCKRHDTPRIHARHFKGG